MLTQDRLKELFCYNEETGIFTRLVSTARHVKVGDVAFTKNSNGYLQITIDKKSYYSHRLAWLYTYGIFPKLIDHINGIRDDNRILNLREVTPQENSQNQKKHKRIDASIPTGVQVVKWKGIQIAYRANWKDISGKDIYSHSFNFNKCGSQELALQKALTYRESRISELNKQGGRYTTRHGQI